MTVDQITVANKANMDTVNGLSLKAYTGFAKLVKLNMAAAKALMNESFAHTQSLFAAKDIQQVLALQTGLVGPMAEKTASYSRHLYGIAVETGAGFNRALEGKAAEGQKAFYKATQAMTRKAPAGSEPAPAVLKSALVSSQSAIEPAQSAAATVSKKA